MNTNGYQQKTLTIWFFYVLNHLFRKYIYLNLLISFFFFKNNLHQILSSNCNADFCIEWRISFYLLQLDWIHILFVRKPYAQSMFKGMSIFHINNFLFSSPFENGQPITVKKKDDQSLAIFMSSSTTTIILFI